MGKVTPAFKDSQPFLSKIVVSTNSIAPCSVYKPYTTHNSSIRSDEVLTLETLAFKSLYGGQFTLSTPLINLSFVMIIALLHLSYYSCIRKKS